jgi:hypothetical protein
MKLMNSCMLFKAGLGGIVMFVRAIFRATFRTTLRADEPRPYDFEWDPSSSVGLTIGRGRLSGVPKYSRLTARQSVGFAVFTALRPTEGYRTNGSS